MNRDQIFNKLIAHGMIEEDKEDLRDVFEQAMDYMEAHANYEEAFFVVTQLLETDYEICFINQNDIAFIIMIDILKFNGWEEDTVNSHVVHHEFENRFYSPTFRPREE